MIFNFIRKQSYFTEEMEYYIDIFRNINWFFNCSEELNDDSIYFDYIQENNIEKVKDKWKTGRRIS